MSNTTALPQPLSQSMTYLTGRNLRQQSNFKYIGWADLTRMAKNPATGIKEKKNLPFVAPFNAKSKRKADAIAHNNYTMLVADDDDNNRLIESVIQLLEDKGLGSFIVYSTFSHKMPKNRWRVFIELSEPLDVDHWEALQGYLCKLLDGDNCAEKAVQIAFLPAVAKGGYEYKISDGLALDPFDLTHPFNAGASELKKRQEKEIREAEAAAKALPKKTEAVTDGQISVIDTVNNAYEWADLLIEAGLKKRGKSWLHPNSTSRSPGVYILPDSDAYFSHHSQATDPLADGHKHDKFDFICQYRYGGDFKAALKGEGDKLTTHTGESITKHNQRIYMRQQAANNSADGFIVDLSQTGGAESDDSRSPKPDKKRGIFVDIRKLQSRPPHWLITDYIERNTLNCVFGDPGAGKSFVAIDMALCVANGADWSEQKTEQGGVIYITGEGHNGIKRRIDAWEKYHNIETPEGRFILSTCPVLLGDPKAAEIASIEIKQIINEADIQPSLIVVDTLARNMGGDENNTKDMNDFIINIDTYLRVPHSASVLIVHHTGHADKSRARGSMAFKGALDSEYKVVKTKNGGARMINTKMKEFEPPETVDFSFVTVDLEDDKTSAVLKTDGKHSPKREHDTEEALKFSDDTDEVNGGSLGRLEDNTAAMKILNDLYDQHRANLEESSLSPAGARVNVKDWREAVIQYIKKVAPNNTDGTPKKSDSFARSYNRIKKDLEERQRITITHPYVYLYGSDMPEKPDENRTNDRTRPDGQESDNDRTEIGQAQNEAQITDSAESPLASLGAAFSAVI